MSWFTPAFSPAPPPSTVPEIVYKTALPVAPHQRFIVSRGKAAQAQAPKIRYIPQTTQVVAPAQKMVVPFELQKTVYLSFHHQGTVKSALSMIARQTGYTFIDEALGSHVVLPRNCGIAWMSGVPDGESAIDDMLLIGRVVGQHMTVRVDPNRKTIILIKNPGAE